MKKLITKEQALEYHSRGRKGKIEVVPTKPCQTQRDLAMAYTPGVAEPCLEIEKNPDLAFSYTAKGNLVAVISNGTAVLGLGNIGALAGKPVMEGKGVLFKRFADVDVFDIELATEDPYEIIKAVKLLEPTFGGINLEDIKAPECFLIEETLKREMNIPVFHDDQHGTAIISGAALINALELVGKKPGEVRVVFNGAGASGIACANHYVQLGVKRENIILCDTTGVIYKGRTKGMNPYKEKFAVETEMRTLAEAVKGADVLCGLSAKGAFTSEMLASMNENPVVFAMANPDPEISYPEAIAVRKDLIMATGRSDYPNQVNNVLGFPFIFRGALDVRATAINEEMKVAATMALARLAKEPVPEDVLRAYDADSMEFGREYLIPKPFDPRVLLWEAVAVAKAAIETGVAQKKINLDEYREQLEARLGRSREVMRFVIKKARKAPKKIVYPEGENIKILQACQIILDEKIATPILLGNKEVIGNMIKEHNLAGLDGINIIDHLTSTDADRYAQEFYNLRQRKGATLMDASRIMKNRNYFGSMMVHLGDADGLISGVTQHYPETISPALEIIKTRDGIKKVAGLYMMIFKNDIYFFADTTVNTDTDAATLADIAILTAEYARKFDVEPRIAMLSFSNFGSTKHASSDKVREATEIVKKRVPELMIDGEMNADAAVVPEILEKHYPFSSLKGKANVLIFPDLQSGNIAYKLMQRLGGAEAVGPVLMGMRKPVHLLQVGTCEVKDIVNMTAIAVVDAQD